MEKVAPESSKSSPRNFQKIEYTCRAPKKEKKFPAVDKTTAFHTRGPGFESQPDSSAPRQATLSPLPNPSKRT